MMMFRRMNFKPTAALLAASCLYYVPAAAAPCPGGAAWCDDFEHGAANWSGAVNVQAETAGNHVLLVRGDGHALLVPASETAPAAREPYFVEARVRPAPAANGVAGQVYLIARWVDQGNWLGLELDVQPGANLPGLNIVRMQDGKLERLKKADVEASAPGAYTTLRLEAVGSGLTMYADGNRINGVDLPLPSAGRIGLMARGGAFQVDDLRLGPARVAPARIGMARAVTHLSLQAGDGAQRYPVRTVGTRGGASGFSARSSDPGVARAAIDGDALVITPIRAGQATITVSSAVDNNVAVAIDTRVGAAFSTSNRPVPLVGKVAPAVQAGDVQVDTLLKLRFDTAPVLGDSGSVRIYRALDDVLVDVIRAGSEVNEIGASPDGVRRVVRYNPFEIDGAAVTIHPHDARLAYDTEYYVLVDANLFKGAALGRQPFAGIGKDAGWRFRTRAHAPAARVLTVDDDGPADFRTVQGALDHAMRSVPRDEPVTIRIADGRYTDLLYLRGKNKVTLRGESRDGAVIAVRNSNGINPGAGGGQAQDAPGAGGGRAAFLVEDADLLHLDNLSLVNTTWRGKPQGGQAEAINFASEGRLIATDANFVSEQDTVLVSGWAWFYHSLIAGNVDFIWGYNHATMFEEDDIRSLGDSAGAGKGGYIVQARTRNKIDPGFVFLNSRITHGPGPAGNDVPPGSTTLARPGTWDNVSYINCRMDAHIAARGWSGEPHGGAGWYEYHSMDMNGRPLDLSQRAGGAVLSAEQAARFSSRARVFAGYDNGKGWNPAATELQQ
jgi:pectin methylesterase-like acyl-CoA thioesterase